MLSVLDDQCKFPKATDEAFSHKLKETLSGHSHFGVTPRVPGDFIVLHYAGPVQYSSTGFLDKNKDTLNAGEDGRGGTIPGLEVTCTTGVMEAGAYGVYAYMGVTYVSKLDACQTCISRCTAPLSSLPP